jgi:adenosylmethionine-8-amino-7-oxononanoate aminotransferase
MDEKFMHAATYSGHPVCCAVGLRNIDILEQEGLPERAAVMGKRLLTGLESLNSLPVVGEVRGLGMMCGVELVEDKASRKPAIGLGPRVVAEAMKRGLIIRQRGGGGTPVSGDSLCIAPPLMTPEATLDRIVSIVGESIQAAV